MGLFQHRFLLQLFCIMFLRESKHLDLLKPHFYHCVCLQKNVRFPPVTNSFQWLTIGKKECGRGFEDGFYGAFLFGSVQFHGSSCESCTTIF